MTFPAGLFLGVGIPKGPRVNTFAWCGTCDSYHRTDFTGDCRENTERYHDLPPGAVEVFSDGTASEA